MVPDTLTGLVIDRYSPLYDAARQDYNTGLPPFFPDYIVYCQDVHDIQNAVRWSRAHRRPLRARSGGHSYEGYSLVDGGVVIDVSPLQGVSLDERGAVATVGAGAQLLPIYQELWDRGRVTIPGGSCPTVGIAGLTLGGGFGLISRQYGLTCDALESLEMVTAQGDVVKAGPSEHEDLFWASCGGGGGNFGIVSAFHFRTFPVSKVTVFTLSWPWEDLRQVVGAFQRWADPTGLDRRVVPILTLTSKKAGHVAVAGEFLGPPGEMLSLLAPLIEAATPADIHLRYVDYIDAVYFFGGVTPPGAPEANRLSPLLLPHAFSSEPHEKFKNTSAYQFDLFPEEAIDTLIEWLGNTPGEADLVQFDAYGGAISDIGNHATAFAHRRGVRSSLQYQAYWQKDSEAPAHRRWVEGFRRAMLPWAHAGYVNYIDMALKDWPRAYYDDNLRRLLRVKRAWDPDNIFDFPQGLGQLVASEPTGGNEPV